MQMIQNPWGVTVYGAASVQAAPDLARLRFKVVRLEGTPQKAFKVVGDSVEQVRRTLRHHGIADGAVQKSRIGMTTAYSYDSGMRKLIGYQCSAAFVVETRNMDDVQPLLVDLVSAGANEIEGVDFDVIAKPELRAQSRREAVAAARRKAELYAEAAGVRLGNVVHIDDVDPEATRAEQYRGHGEASGAAGEQGLAPGHVVVSAAVILGLTISAP